MKVTNTGRPASARKAGAARGATAAPAAAEPLSTKITIAGIPETELTPRVRQALFQLLEEVGQLRDELKQARAELDHLKTLADADPLLGVKNRRAFVQELDRALALVERYGTPASLVFIDLNDLKIINDRFGHAAGDAALAHVATTISQNIRTTDTFGRLGGDEFGLILMMTEEDVALEKTKSLSAAVSASPIEFGGVAHRLGVACGVFALRPKTTAEEAIGEADARMYERKRREKAAAR